MTASSFRQTQRDFTDHLRDPAKPLPHSLQPLEERRLNIYRELIFKNIEGFISGGFPMLRQLYSEANWLALVRDFIILHSCDSPYFLDISQEFLEYLQSERQMLPSDPVFMLELAHYEWVEMALDVSEEELPLGDLAPGEYLTEDLLAELPLASPLAWTLSYQFPVHLIGPDYQPESVPQQPTFLVVYRNRQHDVLFMESNALTVRLLDLLSAGEYASGLTLLEQLATEIQHPDVAVFTELGLDLMKRLQKSDIIL